MSLTESPIEQAAIEWFWDLGCAIIRGPHLALGGQASARDPLGQVVLVGCLREPIRRLNLAIRSYTPAILSGMRMPNVRSDNGFVPTVEEKLSLS